MIECTMPRGCAINVTWSFQPRMLVCLEPCCLQKKWRRRHTQQLNQELLNSVNTYVDQQYPSYYGDMNSGYGNRAVYSQGHPYQTYPPMPPSHQVVRNSAGCLIYGLTNNQFSGNVTAASGGALSKLHALLQRALSQGMQAPTRRP